MDYTFYSGYYPVYLEKMKSFLRLTLDKQEIF